MKIELSIRKLGPKIWKNKLFLSKKSKNIIEKKIKNNLIKIIFSKKNLIAQKKIMKNKKFLLKNYKKLKLKFKIQCLN